MGTVVMTQAIDGAREKQAILNRGVQIAPSRWLRDGSGLLLDARGPTTGGDLLVATPQSGQQPTLLTSEPGQPVGRVTLGPTVVIWRMPATRPAASRCGSWPIPLPA